MVDIFTELLSTDGPGLLGVGQDSLWGIFKDGEPVVVADSVNRFGFKQEWPLSTYPIEEGGFETYDKVQLPFETRVSFMTGGGEEDRQALIDSIESIAGDLELYDVVTPEKVYISCNITRYDYDRIEGPGAGMVRVNVHLSEVRINSSTQFNTASPITQAKNPTANDQVNNGTVQPSAIPSAEHTAVNAATSAQGGW